MSVGSRSRRVDSIWPNLMKIGPRSSRARRKRTPRGAKWRARTAPRADGPQGPHARVSERQVVETVPKRDDDDPQEPTQPHGPDCTGALDPPLSTNRGRRLRARLSSVAMGSTLRAGNGSREPGGAGC